MVVMDAETRGEDKDETSDSKDKRPEIVSIWSSIPWISITKDDLLRIDERLLMFAKVRHVSGKAAEEWREDLRNTYR